MNWAYFNRSASSCNFEGRKNEFRVVLNSSSCKFSPTEKSKSRKKILKKKIVVESCPQNCILESHQTSNLFFCSNLIELGTFLLNSAQF